MTKTVMEFAHAVLPTGDVAYCLRLCGNKKFDDFGKEAMQTAQSILLQSTIAALESLQHTDPDCIEMLSVGGMRENMGLVVIHVVPTMLGYERVEGILETCLAGFGLLSLRYPDRMFLIAHNKEDEDEHET